MSINRDFRYEATGNPLEKEGSPYIDKTLDIIGNLHTGTKFTIDLESLPGSFETEEGTGSWENCHAEYTPYGIIIDFLDRYNVGGYREKNLSTKIVIFADKDEYGSSFGLYDLNKQIGHKETGFIFGRKRRRDGSELNMAPDNIDTSDMTQKAVNRMLNAAGFRICELCEQFKRMR